MNVPEKERPGRQAEAINLLSHPQFTPEATSVNSLRVLTPRASSNTILGHSGVPIHYKLPKWAASGSDSRCRGTRGEPCAGMLTCKV